MRSHVLTPAGEKGYNVLMITSRHNAKLKLARRLLNERKVRAREKAYVIEGTRAVLDYLDLGLEPRFILATPAWIGAQAGLPTTPTAVDAALLAEISGVENDQGVLAVVSIRTLALPLHPSLLLIVDRLQDPGNLGTLLRSAAAAGCDGVLLTPETVDPYNPKTVRSAMGALERIPVQQLSDAAVLSHCEGMRLWATAAAGEHAYTSVDFSQPGCIVIGNEGSGVSRRYREAADAAIAIPMARATESLNAAMAATVILFEAQRQRLASRH